VPRPTEGRTVTFKPFRPQLCLLEDRRVPANLPTGFIETPLATGLTEPTAFAAAPDGRIFVSQQTGDLRVIKNDQLLPTPFVSLQVDSLGERGLLGVAFDPNFESNGFVYVYYTTPENGSHNRVSRFTANGDVAVPGSEVPLLDLPTLTNTNHNGGSMQFGLDGKLYIGVGENGNGANSQSLDTPLGKFLRINSDGSIPPDNPFFTQTTGINRAIWAMGLRNPFTFDVERGTGTIYINDVGQSSYEEIDLGIPGANYGWPASEGPLNTAGFTAPIFSYPHGTGPEDGDAIAGGAFYDSTTQTFPGYDGKYFFADYVNGWIHVFDPKTGTSSDFATGLNGPTGLTTDSAGNLYYVQRGTSTNGGSVVRVSFPQAVTPPLVVGADAGGAPMVNVYDPQTRALRASFFAYDSSFTGGVRVAVGDVDGDGVADIITAAGRGGGPHVKVFSGVDYHQMQSFYAYDSSFTGGVFVAAADLNGDGKADIITGAGRGGGPHVRAFSGADNTLLANFFAYDSSFTGGVSVAAGDVNGDGMPDIVVGGGPGGEPQVKVFSADGGTLLQSYDAYGSSFTKGVYVAAGDLTGDGKAEVITGTGRGGGSEVRVFDGATEAMLHDFAAFGSSYRGGVRVGVSDANGDGVPDILAGSGLFGSSTVNVYDGLNLNQLASFSAFSPGFRGVFVAGV
jgi:glucose/arabinose dehydrogenase